MVAPHTKRNYQKVHPTFCINHDCSSFCTKHDCFYTKDLSFILDGENYLYSKREREEEATRYKSYMVEVKYREFAFNMTFGVEIDSTF